MAKSALARAARLQRIEEMLLSAPDGYTIIEIASRLGIDRTLIWRDMNELEEVLPIQKRGSRYSLDRMQYLSNVRLTQGESLMLYLAMRHMIRRTTHIPPIMLTSLEKLSIVLRNPLATQLAESIVHAQQDKPTQPERAKVWDILIRGWLEQVTVRIRHLKFNYDQPNLYEIQPYFFEPAVLSEGVYVVGHSVTHGALRTFKVERILAAQLTTESFTRPETINLDVMLRHAWGIWYGEKPTEVCLRFRHPAARRVCETTWHPLQEIEEVEDGSIIWRVHVAGTTELIPWIRGWGADCEVLAPDSLRRFIAEDLRQAAQQYQDKE